MTQQTCPQPRRWRLAASALLDGEPLPVPREKLDAHLTACPDCRAWLAQARRLSPDLRRDSLRPPDLTRMLIGATEAHICGCHTGGDCACTDCQCETCTCQPVA